MITFATARAGMLARLSVALAALSLLVSCSGAVSGPPAAPPNSGPLVVTPTTATLYSDLPFDFFITGGTGSYVVVSGDQVALPVSGVLQGNVLTVVPGPVAADTPVTLTIRDTGTATPVLVSATVKPRTTSSTVTVTPSPSQSAVCGTSICAGGDAEVKIVLSQNGAPLANREVRFDVLSGDFRLISGNGVGGETLVFSTTTLTDSTGTARVRVRALANAPAQTGLLQITDLVSGSSTTTGISIAPSSNAPLNAQPSTITFRGPDQNTCASGIAADVIVFGGRPPYSITQPGTFQVFPLQLNQAGDRFQVQATGQCTSGSAIAIVDANGATVTVTASNVTGGTGVNPPPLVVSPTTVTLETCNGIANVSLAGGSTPYFVTSSTPFLDARVVARPGNSGGTGTIRRSRTDDPGLNAYTVTFSDGRTTEDVTVELRDQARGDCNPPPP